MSALHRIGIEQAAALAKHGPQDHVPDVHPMIRGYDAHVRASAYYGIPTELNAKRDCDRRFADGQGSWADILVEELAEAIDAAARGDLEALVDELVQVGAMAATWVEVVERRAAAALANVDSVSAADDPGGPRD